MYEKEKKLMINSALLLLGNFSSKILVFLLVPFYTSILSTEEYAVSDLLVTTVNLLYPFFTLMISAAVLRFCLDKGEDVKQIFTIGLSIEIVGIGILSILSFFIKTGALVEYRGYFIAYYAAYALYTLLLQYAKGTEKVFIYAAASVCNTVVLLSCNLLFLLKFNLGIKGYVLAMICSFAVTAVLLFWGSGAWKDIISIRKVDRRKAKEMVAYSLPLMPNSISWWISNSSDRYIMRIFRDLSELGLYSISYKIPSILSTISGIMINAWEISAAEEYGNEKNDQFFSKIYHHYVEMLMVISTILIVMVKPIATILFQNEFYNAWKFVPILIFASVFNVLSSFLGTIFTAAKKTRSIFITTVIGALSNIALNFCLIPKFGAYGAAIATAASYILTFVARIYGSQKIMKLHYNKINHLVKFTLLFLLTCMSSMDFLGGYIIGTIIFVIEYRYIVSLLKMIFSKIFLRKIK